MSLKMEPQSELLTVRQVAEMLNIHANTVRRWADQGLLDSCRIGTRGIEESFVPKLSAFFQEHRASEPASHHPSGAKLGKYMGGFVTLTGLTATKLFW